MEVHDGVKNEAREPSFLACDALPRGHVELLGEGVSAQVFTERHAWNIIEKRSEGFGAKRGVRGGGRAEGRVAEWKQFHPKKW